MLRHAVWYTFTDVSDVLTAPITHYPAEVNTSETSVNFYHITWRNIPEDSHLHTRRREKVKSHQNRVI
jgi:hypothetical protein